MAIESSAQMPLPLPLFAQAAIEAPAPPPAPPAVAAAPPTVEDDRLRLCIENAGKDAPTALADASAWVEQARGVGRSKALECLGQVHTVLLRWDAAETAFVEASAAAGDDARRAALLVQAGNAALAGSHPDRALVHFDAALALPNGVAVERGQTSVDRGRALVALGRFDAAVDAFTAAQRDAPDEPDAWLLGATLARRRGDLAAAQRQIDVAAVLAPKDPEVGLEAGVIAMLAGRAEAARKAWESVRLVAPESQAAETAKGYLAQLGDAPKAPQGR
jgi:tetratricopeptide (TPR) repeat protein